MSGERLTDRSGGTEKRIWILVAVICAILLGVSAVMFVPVKSKMNETLPAMMFSRKSGETQATTLTLNGTWGQQRMGKSAMTYEGVVGTAALDDTLWDGMDPLDFTLNTDTQGNHLIGGFFYNHYYTENHEEGYGWLFTDRERSCYLLVTGPLADDNNSEDEEYIIAAPAANAAEAEAICEKLEAYTGLFIEK